MDDADAVARFGAFGFVVLRGAFDPGPLCEEFDRSRRDGFLSTFEADVGGSGIAGTYVPMMCERTPVSLSLLDRFAGPAADLLGSAVLPVRAKAVLYFGDAGWHNDSGHNVRSMGFACYLDSLQAGNGALRVIPGSHRPEYASAVEDFCRRRRQGVDGADDRSWVTAVPSHVVETEPGDVIAFDEHLYHASVGGRNRRQWRVDYVMDPIGADEEAKVRAYYASIYPPDWDGGYDVDRYPSYGSHWLASGRPSVHRLGQLGVYEAAQRQEAFGRSRRG